MTHESNPPLYAYRQWRAYAGLVLGVVVLIVGAGTLASGDAQSGLVLAGMGLLLMAVSVVFLDSLRASAAAYRAPGHAIPMDRRARHAEEIAAALSVVAGLGGVGEWMLGNTKNALTLGVGAAIVIIAAIALPRLARARTATPNSSADAAAPAWRRKRQFGRPKVALAIGAAFTVIGVIAAVFDRTGTSHNGTPNFLLGPALIVAGVVVAALAVRQLRAR